MSLIFSTICVLGKKIRLSEHYWRHVLVLKHTELLGKEAVVVRAVADADFVRRSRSDPAVYLYYLAYNEYWLCVVCRHENGTGFVVTVYLTDRVKKGQNIWAR